jgi:hypothetical protein
MKEWNKKEENSETVTHMTGWKTKLAAFLAAAGTALIGISESVPTDDSLAPMIKFIGIVIDGLAGAFGIWGIGHKLEKNKSILIQKKTVPYYVHPMNEKEFEILEKMRQEKIPEAPTL